MGKRYQIWDKQSDIYTHKGEHFTAAEWLERHAWAGHPDAVPVISAGVINGGVMEELGDMKRRMEGLGCEFDQGLSPEQLLAAIETAEEILGNPENLPPSAEERTAAALEFLALNSLPDQA